MARFRNPATGDPINTGSDPGGDDGPRTGRGEPSFPGTGDQPDDSDTSSPPRDDNSDDRDRDDDDSSDRDYPNPIEGDDPAEGSAADDDDDGADDDSRTYAADIDDDDRRRAIEQREAEERVEELDPTDPDSPGGTTVGAQETRRYLAAAAEEDVAIQNLEERPALASQVENLTGVDARTITRNRTDDEVNVQLDAAEGELRVLETASATTDASVPLERRQSGGRPGESGARSTATQERPLEGGDARLLVASRPSRPLEGGDVRLLAASRATRGFEGGDVRLSINERDAAADSRPVRDDRVTDLVRQFEATTGLDVPGEGPVATESPEGEQFGDFDTRFPGFVPFVGGQETDTVASNIADGLVEGARGAVNAREQDLSLPGVTVGTAAPPNRDPERVTAGEKALQDTAAGAAAIGGLLVETPQEAAEFVTYGATETAAGRGGEFVGQVGDAATNAAVRTAEASLRDPAGVGFQAAGSALASGAAIGGAARLGGPRAARAASVGIQPGEELAITAARAGAIPSRAARAVPGVSRQNIEAGGTSTTATADATPGRLSRAADRVRDATETAPTVRTGRTSGPRLRIDPQVRAQVVEALQPSADSVSFGRPLSRDVDSTPVSERVAAAGRQARDRVAEAARPRQRTLAVDSDAETATTARNPLARPLASDVDATPLSERIGAATRRLREVGRPEERTLSVADDGTAVFDRNPLGRPLASDVDATPLSERVAGLGRRLRDAGQPEERTLSVADDGTAVLDRNPLGRPLASDVDATPLSERVAGLGRRLRDAGQPEERTLSVADDGTAVFDRNPLGRPLASDVDATPLSERVRELTADRGPTASRETFGRPLASDVDATPLSERAADLLPERSATDSRDVFGRPLASDVDSTALSERAAGLFDRVRSAGRPEQRTLLATDDGDLTTARNPLGRPLASDVGATPVTERLSSLARTRVDVLPGRPRRLSVPEDSADADLAGYDLTAEASPFAGSGGGDSGPTADLGDRRGGSGQIQLLDSPTETTTETTTRRRSLFDDVRSLQRTERPAEAAPTPAENPAASPVGGSLARLSDATAASVGPGAGTGIRAGLNTGLDLGDGTATGPSVDTGIDTRVRVGPEARPRMERDLFSEVRTEPGRETRTEVSQETQPEQRREIETRAEGRRSERRDPFGLRPQSEADAAFTDTGGDEGRFQFSTRSIL